MMSMTNLSRRAFFQHLLSPSPKRRYWPISLSDAATTRHTHAVVTGTVTYVRKMADGDYHLTLDDGTTRLVCEIIPAIPLPPPRKGQRVRVWGITRQDRHHGWPEIHPIERLDVL